VDDQRATSRENALADEMLMACDLDTHRLEVIERARDGRPPTFSVQLWPVLIMGSRRLNAKIAAIRIEVPRDSWMGFLRDVGFRDKVILEIAIPEYASDQFKEAVQQVYRAQDHLLAGRVEQCLSQCRVVWEAVRAELGDGLESEKLRAMLNDRVGNARADAYMSIIRKTKGLAAAPGHLYGARAPSMRNEAQILLVCTATLLALVTELAPEALRPADVVPPMSQGTS
jgi:hypothetical protein